MGPMVREYSVIIPAYNEQRTIVRAIRETMRFFDTLHAAYEVIVVDDGSTDKTAAAVSRMRSASKKIHLIRFEKNQGKGAAVRKGVEAASGKIFLFLDADLATHPSEFKKFIPVLKKADIVIGSRTARGSVIAKRQPLYRILAGKLFNRVVVRWYLGLPFRDTQCGFKAFHANAKPLFRDMTSSGWAFDAEILARARSARLRIAEIPVEWRHGRESRVHIRDILQIMRELHRIKKAL